MEHKPDIIWLDGEKTSLGDKEVIISSDLVSYYYQTDYGMYEVQVVEPDKNETQDYSFLKGKNYTLDYITSGDEWKNESGYKVVGVIDVNSDKMNLWYNSVIVDGGLYELLSGGVEAGEYRYVVGNMPDSRQNIEKLIKYSYNMDGNVRFALQNAVTYELDTVNTVLKAFSKVFFWIGFGFAIFAALMLANFIGTSISYKKQEIGILRAIGSRSNDVFRIFFSESFIIAMINFVLSSIGVAVATFFINRVIRYGAGILITVLHFGIRQILLLLVLSIAIAALASFIPVKKIASKKPIDAIRNR
ncbi:MAG: ABC transporter permease [Butyrivibrio sp.]